MKISIVICALVLVVGCRSKQDASIVYDSSAIQQPEPQQQPPTQAAPTTGMPQIVSKSGDTVITADGLKWIDTKIGKGASPKPGGNVTANYTGMLTNGKVFDSNVDPAFHHTQPFKTSLGGVIPGWQEGMVTMKVGGKRRLIVPPQLGYGAQGAGNDIPPNATLIFDIELLAAE